MGGGPRSWDGAERSAVGMKRSAAAEHVEVAGDGGGAVLVSSCAPVRVGISAFSDAERDPPGGRIASRLVRCAVGPMSLARAK